MTTEILNPVDFRIDGGICIKCKTFDNNSNTECLEKPLDAYKSSTNEAVLENTSCENEFISIAPSENVVPESLTNDILYEELNPPHIFPTGNVAFQSKRKVPLLLSLSLSPFII